MGTGRSDVFELLKSNLQDRDDAIVGEAAGIAMGLVMMGTNNGPVIEEMCSYAADTQHEKIVRGLAIGVAMVVYNRLEEADALIDQLLKAGIFNAEYFISLELDSILVEPVQM